MTPTTTETPQPSHSSTPKIPDPSVGFDVPMPASSCTPDASSDIVLYTPPSPSSSDSSIDIVLSAYSPSSDSRLSPCASNYLQHMLPRPMTDDQIRKESATRRAVRWREKQHLLLVARLGPEGAAALDEKRCQRKELKTAEFALLKRWSMLRELKRARNTKVSPNAFEFLDVLEIMSRRNSQNAMNSARPGFAGLIVIQGRLDAMRQALSEHTHDGPRRKEPGRHSFYVDAAGLQCEIAGIGVVQKAHRQDWASPWNVKGYRMNVIGKEKDAEAWAIWQALQLTLEKVNTDRGYLKPRDPCSLAVIYSDSMEALQLIRDGSPKGVVGNIIDQSIELRELVVDIELHWVPGHRGVPGNELADIVSKLARRPVVYEDGYTQAKRRLGIKDI